MYLSAIYVSSIYVLINRSIFLFPFFPFVAFLPSIHLSIHPSILPSFIIYLSIHLLSTFYLSCIFYHLNSIYSLFIYFLSNYLSFHPSSIYPSIFPSIHPSIHHPPTCHLSIFYLSILLALLLWLNPDGCAPPLRYFSILPLHLVPFKILL